MKVAMPHITQVFPVSGRPITARCTISEYLTDADREQTSKKAFGFFPYEENRGKRDGEGVARQTVEMVANPATRNIAVSFGTVVVARIGTSSQFMIADGMSRRRGLQLAVESKNLTKEEKATEITVKVVNEADFMTVHGSSNAGEPHSVNVKLKTSGYKANQSTAGLATLVCGKPVFDFVKNDVKFRHKLLQLFVAHRDAKDPRKIGLTDLTADAHRKVSQLFKIDKEIEFPKEIVDALTYVREVYLATTRFLVPLKSVPMGAKFQSESPLFGFLMVDHMTQKEVTGIPAEELGFRLAYQMKATAIGSKDNKVLAAARSTPAQLLRREVTFQALAELKRYLNPNSKTILASMERGFQRSKTAVKHAKEIVSDSPINSRLRLDHDKVMAAFHDTGKYAVVARRFGTSATSIRRIITGK